MQPCFKLDQFECMMHENYNDKGEVSRKMIFKGKRNLSGVADGFIGRDVERRVAEIIEASSEIGYSEELEEVVRRIREGPRARL